MNLTVTQIYPVVIVNKHSGWFSLVIYSVHIKILLQTRDYRLSCDKHGLAF